MRHGGCGSRDVAWMAWVAEGLGKGARVATLSLARTLSSLNSPVHSLLDYYSTTTQEMANYSPYPELNSALDSSLRIP
jgi:hypothetical protein